MFLILSKFNTDPIDEDDLLNQDRVGMLVTARGGHIAFLEGLFPLSKRNEYMHRVSIQFFNAMFRDNAYKEFVSQSWNLYSSALIFRSKNK